MHSFLTPTLAALILAFTAQARDVPSNVQTFYNQLKTKGSCTDKLATGFYSTDGGSNTFSYCNDHHADYNVLYIQGTGGKFANMDIDCDGAQGGPADDGRCGNSDDTQSITSFADTVRGYNKGVNDLDAKIHPYVVFGNSGTRAGYKTFDPQAYGIQPLSIMAVVCGNKLIYGVWGDENGDDGTKSMVGEASISLATACYGTGITGNNGHDQDDVLYIAFPGADAVPGANGANWGASSYSSFESSITALGDKLIQRIKAGGSGSPTTTAPPPAGTCSWTGHCAGASCSTGDDCDGDLICKSGKCASSGAATTAPPPVATCSWTGHCAGASCASENDCDGSLVCRSGRCAV